MALNGITHDAGVDSIPTNKRRKTHLGTVSELKKKSELTTTAQGVLAARRVSALAVQRRRDSGSCRHLCVLLERCNVMGSRHLARSDLNSKVMVTWVSKAEKGPW